MTLFRQLTDEEDKAFKQWARNNYNPGKDNISPVWHPVVKKECLIMCEEYYGKPKKA